MPRDPDRYYYATVGLLYDSQLYQMLAADAEAAGTSVDIMLRTKAYEAYRSSGAQLMPSPPAFDPNARPQKREKKKAKKPLNERKVVQFDRPAKEQKREAQETIPEDFDDNAALENAFDALEGML